MTKDERGLLLTVARVLRAQIRDRGDQRTAHEGEDLWALKEAMKPFDPNPVHGGDFADHK